MDLLLLGRTAIIRRFILPLSLKGLLVRVIITPFFPKEGYSEQNMSRGLVFWASLSVTVV
jgi:hypothetical protein